MTTARTVAKTAAARRRISLLSTLVFISLFSLHGAERAVTLIQPFALTTLTIRIHAVVVLGFRAYALYPCG